MKSLKNIFFFFIPFIYIYIHILTGLTYAQTRNTFENLPDNVPSEVRQYIKKLSSKDPIERGEAAQELASKGKLASSAAPFLIHLLGDTHHILWQKDNKIVASSSVDKEALKALSSIGKPAVDLLIVALNDKNADIRKNAAEALGEIKDTRAINPLIASLGDEDTNVRKNAAEALGKIGDIRAIEPLVASLYDKKSTVKSSAEKALKKIFDNMKDSHNVEQLFSLLEHKEAFVRRLAITTIKGSKDSRTVEHLILALKDDDPVIRDSAAEALREIGEPAVKPLINVLKDEGDMNARIKATMILGDIKDNRAIEPLIDALKYKSEAPGQESTILRVEAAKALGTIKDARAAGPLIEALSVEDMRVRESAAVALRQIGKPAVEPLIASLKSNSMSVKLSAAMILGDLKDNSAVEPLIQELLLDSYDETSWVFRAAFRFEAARALGKIKDPRATEVLKTMLNDDVTSVRDIAEWALNEITGKESEKEDKSWWQTIF